MKTKIKILVTGSEGFVGSHLVEGLLKTGYSVRAFVYYNSFNNIGWLTEFSSNYKNLEIYFGDIRDHNSVLNSLKGIDIIYNLAALISIPYSYKSPESYIDVNTYGTFNLLNAARKYKIKKFFQISTSEVYGSAEYIPIDENHPLKAQSPYAATKIAADQISYSFMCSYDLPIVILRPFNIFGPRQSLRAIIPTIISQVINNKKEINLGNIYSTRDFNFVEDTINSMIAMINLKNNLIIGEVFNIGSGYEISIKELVNKISIIASKSLTIKNNRFKNRPTKSEVDRLNCNSGKLKKILKFKFNYSGKKNIDQGLFVTYNWFKKNKNNNNYTLKNKNNYE